MKRILSMGLALLMLLGAVCIPVSASMPDNPHPYDHEGYIRPGDKFRPYDALTRAEMACLLYRMLDDEQKRDSFVGYDCKFTDVDIPQNTWYGRALMNLDLLGIVKGYEDGTFRPNTNITRAQACVIVNRALGRSPDEDRLLDEDEMITWPDNNPEDWFYADMQEATNSHDYTWVTVSGDKVEKWTEKLEQRDWAALEHAWSTAHSAPGGEGTK